MVVNRVVLHRVELPSVAAGHPDVTRIASFDDVVQSVHGLSSRRILVKAMALEDIDVIELESFKRMFD